MVGKTKVEPKNKKNTGTSKRPLSAYLFYAKDARPKLREQNPDLSFGELSKALGAAWKSLSEEEKKPFVELATEAREKTATVAVE